MVFEVKNIHRWIYPWVRELWEFLVKAADLYQHLPVLPVMVCVRYAYQTQQMAQDIGFLVRGTGEQLFSPRIPERQFAHVKAEFGLAMLRHEGPREEIVDFGRFIRRTPFRGPEPWYRRQIQRFRVMVPIILAHDALAGALPEDDRSRVYASFKTQALALPSIQFTQGW